MSPPPKSPSPPLSLVGKEATVEPLRPLGEHGAALWNAILRDFEIEDRAGLEMLQQCCAAVDLAETLAAVIARDGPVLQGKGRTLKAHPAVRDELAARGFVCRQLQRLGLNLQEVRPGPGRPIT